MLRENVHIYVRTVQLMYINTFCGAHTLWNQVLRNFFLLSSLGVRVFYFWAEKQSAHEKYATQINVAAFEKANGKKVIGKLESNHWRESSLWETGKINLFALNEIFLIELCML